MLAFVRTRLAARFQCAAHRCLQSLAVVDPPACLRRAFQLRVGRAGRTFDALDFEGGDLDSVDPTPRR